MIRLSYCRVRFLRAVLLAGSAIALVAVLNEPALACPTCKDQLAHDPEAANLARGFYYSILFMLSMPPLIFSSLVAYFYWEVRKARARGPASREAIAANA